MGKLSRGGQDYSCALLTSGQVKCWGWNMYGQLGQGHANNLGDGLDENGESEMGDNLSAINLGEGVKVKAIATGYFHVCALLNDDTVKCWGRNVYGELGQGHINNLGDGLDENGESEMGDNLPTVDLGINVVVKAIAAGGLHSCALLSDDTVKCWGNNSTGQMGQGHINNLGDGLDENGESEMGDNLPTINLGVNLIAKSIAGGYRHNCALLSNNTLKCWGRNQYGQLGQGHKRSLGDNFNANIESEMGDNLPTVDLGDGLTVRVMTTGGLHTCAILSNEVIKCWGDNISGQLGQGHNESVGDEEHEMGNNLP